MGRGVHSCVVRDSHALFARCVTCAPSWVPVCVHCTVWRVHYIVWCVTCAPSWVPVMASLSPAGTGPMSVASSTSEIKTMILALSFVFDIFQYYNMMACSSGRLPPLGKNGLHHVFLACIQFHVQFYTSWSDDRVRNGKFYKYYNMYIAWKKYTLHPLIYKLEKI